MSRLDDSKLGLVEEVIADLLNEAKQTLSGKLRLILNILSDMGGKKGRVEKSALLDIRKVLSRDGSVKSLRELLGEDEAERLIQWLIKRGTVYVPENGYLMIT